MIKIWVLTGDKLETAINIGYLVKHVSSYVSS
jgi:magnesium-transporting ATPase (P-type)